MNEQVQKVVDQGFEQAVSILIHPISGQAQLVFPPLQDAGMTCGLLANTLYAFMAASGNRIRVYLNDKELPLGGIKPVFGIA